MTGLLPWSWRSLPLDRKSGADIFAALFRHQPIAVLLESPPTPDGSWIPNSRFSICAGAPRSHQKHSRSWTPPIGSIFDSLAQRLQEADLASPSDPVPSHLPFVGGWLGWLGYDAAWEIESLPWLRSDPLPFPVAFWYEPSAFAVLDHQEQVLWLAASDPTGLDTMAAQLAQAPVPCDRSPAQCHDLSMTLTQHAFEDKVRTVKAHIQAGDIFQANLSLRFQANGILHPWQLYRTLQSINPSPFASYWQTPWGCVVSCSPERLIKLEQRWASTRPIAGTRPRGDTPDTDQDYMNALINSPKERAEHTMLVDLERNDLGRVCQWGTVQVEEFLTIETYSHVMHLVSNITGRLNTTATPIDLIRSVFPGGTITGCPKIRCMEIIETLEPLRRNLFYGSCGYLDRRGFLDLNILIRTLLTVSPNHIPHPWHLPQNQTVQIWGQVGAGIVADSDPTQEWFESLQKAQAQWAALQKITEHSC